MSVHPCLCISTCIDTLYITLHYVKLYMRICWDPLRSHVKTAVAIFAAAFFLPLNIQICPSLRKWLWSIRKPGCAGTVSSRWALPWWPQMLSVRGLQSDSPQTTRTICFGFLCSSPLLHLGYLFICICGSIPDLCEGSGGLRRRELTGAAERSHTGDKEQAHPRVFIVVVVKQNGYKCNPL